MAKSLFPPKTLSVSVIAPNLSVIDFLTWVTWWGWQQRLIERAACLQALLERWLLRCRKCRLPRLYLGEHNLGVRGGLPEHLDTAASSSHGDAKNSNMSQNLSGWHLVPRESHCRGLPSRLEIFWGNAIYLDSIPHLQPVSTDKEPALSQGKWFQSRTRSLLDQKKEPLTFIRGRCQGYKEHRTNSVNVHLIASYDCIPNMGVQTLRIAYIEYLEYLVNLHVTLKWQNEK